MVKTFSIFETQALYLITTLIPPLRSYPSQRIWITSHLLITWLSYFLKNYEFPETVGIPEKYQCLQTWIWVRCRAVDLPAGRRLMRRPVRPLLLLQSASPTPPPPPTSAPTRVGWPLPASAAASLYLHYRHQPRGRQRLFSKYTEGFGVNLCQFITSGKCTKNKDEKSL